MTREVVVIGALPPPVNGQSKNLQRILNDMKAHPSLTVYSQSVAAGSLSKSIVSHGRKFLRVLHAWALLHRHSRAEQPPLLYLVADGGRGLFYTELLLKTASRLGYEIVLQHRTFHYVDNDNPRIHRIQKMLSGNGFHIFLCQRMQECFEARYGTSVESTIIGNQSQYAEVAEALVAVQSRPEHRRLTVGILSNLYPSKGIDTFLEVAQKLLSGGAEVKFRIAGPSPDPLISSRMEQLQREFPDHVDVLGGLFGEAKETFFNSLDVFYFPTRYPFEAQPNVVIEAQAHGAIVLAPDRGCIASDISETGRVIPRHAEADVELQAEMLSGIGSLGREEIDAIRQNVQALFLQEVDQQSKNYSNFLARVACEQN